MAGGADGVQRGSQQRQRAHPAHCGQRTAADAQHRAQAGHAGHQLCTPSLYWSLLLLCIHQYYQLSHLVLHPYSQLRSASWQSLQSNLSDHRIAPAPSAPPPRPSGLAEQDAPRPRTPPPSEPPCPVSDAANGTASLSDMAVQDTHAEGHAPEAVDVQPQGSQVKEAGSQEGVPSAPPSRPPVPVEHSFAYLLDRRAGQEDPQGGGGEGGGAAEASSVTLQPGEPLPAAGPPKADADGAQHVLSAEMHVATLASLAEQVDIRCVPTV